MPSKVSFDFSGKTALITGGSRGIGAAIARAFLESNAHVIVIYRSHEPNVQEWGYNVIPENLECWQYDLSDKGALFQLQVRLRERKGAIDILVNNAGIYLSHPINTPSLEEWMDTYEQTLRTNLDAAAHMSYICIPYLRMGNAGKIINISSRGAFRGEPNHIAYGISKAGMNSMSQSMALALADQNIHVFCIAPGFVNTDMAEPYIHGSQGEEILAQSPLNRAAKPKEIAALCQFLSTDQTAYLTGCIIDMNGASYLRS